MQAHELYEKAAALFLPHIPWSWVSVDDFVERLENRGFFNQPGFCESRVLRKVLVYQALMRQPDVQFVTIQSAYGATTILRRVT